MRAHRFDGVRGQLVQRQGERERSLRREFDRWALDLETRLAVLSIRLGRELDDFPQRRALPASLVSRSWASARAMSRASYVPRIEAEGGAFEVSPVALRCTTRTGRSVIWIALLPSDGPTRLPPK